ncbi:MAG: glutaredoxin [Pseudohongiella sp.]|nr:glutaredoxin [Pseudohongiella sp.]|tara:strand:- start:266 stop:1033 length:768 start_codon:yes stop_codon:yes gene_type:complete
MTNETTDKKSATLYRMDMPGHLCPFGLKSRHLLRRQGYQVEDHKLRSREDVESFKNKHDVDTTPQTFIGGERIGGYEALRQHFGKESADDEGLSYRPVITLFLVAALMAMSISWTTADSVITGRTFEWFVAGAMTLLGLQKLKDVEAFSSMFLNYDLLAQRYVGYAYLYPFGETLAGLLMIAGALVWISAPVALFIGSVGAVSVFKAVYIDKRTLKCACVGGDSKVPLGFVSLTENLMMMGMGVWMIARAALHNI